MITVQEITSFRNKINGLNMMKAVKSVAIVKQKALTALSKEDEINQQWIADQWFGRCARKSYQDVIAELTN